PCRPAHTATLRCGFARRTAYLPIYWRSGKRQNELASLTHAFAARGERAIVELHDLQREREAEPEAGAFAPFQPHVSIEDLRQYIAGYADTVVADPGYVPRALALEGHRDASAGLRELGRVDE